MKKNSVLAKEIETYIQKHTSLLPDYLQELERETYLKVLMPHMLSGNTQGIFLQLISQMLRPKYVLEIGTFTGYSSICLAKGLSEDGHLYTIDINEELESIAKTYFERAGLSSSITFYSGNALDIIPSFTQKFDIIFIDADKKNYTNYYKLCLSRLSERGIMLIDNVLWDGKVTNTAKYHDKDTLAIHNFNTMVQTDITVTNTIVPIRDGMMLITKAKS